MDLQLSEAVFCIEIRSWPSYMLLGTSHLIAYGSEPTSAIEMFLSRRVLVESFQSIAHLAVRLLAMRVGIFFCGSGFHTGKRRRSTLGRVACGFN